MGLGHGQGRLDQLGPHPGQVDTAKTLAGRGRERIVQVIAHHHQRLLRQGEPPLYRGLGGAAGGEHHLVQAGGPGHPQARLDGVGPGLGRHGPDNAGGAEDGQPADHAQPPVQGLFRKYLAVAHKNTHFDAPFTGAALDQGLGHGRADHPPRHRVDGRLAHCHRQAGLGDHAHARTVPEHDRLTPRFVQPARLGTDLRAVGHVRVIARILDHRGQAGAEAAEFE